MLNKNFNMLKYYVIDIVEENNVLNIILFDIVHHFLIGLVDSI